MDNKEIYASLCYYDARNDCLLLDEDSPPPRRHDCSCDNCFYGRDKLANEILNLQDKIDELNHYAYNDHN